MHHRGAIIAVKVVYSNFMGYRISNHARSQKTFLAAVADKNNNNRFCLSGQFLKVLLRVRLTPKNVP